MRRCLKGILILALLTVMSGCVDYEEEITLSADGSGTVTMHYSMEESTAVAMEDDETSPFLFDAAAIKERLLDSPFKASKIDVYTEDETRHVVIELEFPSLEELQGNWPFEDHTISLTRLSDGTMEYKMIINMTATEEATGEAQEEEYSDGEEYLDDEDYTYDESYSDDQSYTEDYEFSEEEMEQMAEMADAMMHDMLDGYSFKYVVNVPGTIVRAEAGGIVEGKRVTWEFPLDELTEVTELVLTVVYQP